MKILFFLFLSFISILCQANPKIKVSYEYIYNGYNIIIDNPYKCPMSVKIHFEVRNYSIFKGNDKVYVIPAESKKWLVNRLIKIDTDIPATFKYTYYTYYGDFRKKEYDVAYSYDLPYSKSKSFKVAQGYNGKFSHENQNALDFLMPVGTELKAIRDGIVIELVDKNKKGCKKRRCHKYNNYISIYHPDGTVAKYLHIKQKGAVVSIGDKVSKGQLIAYSGNTGWSTLPHLHLVVYHKEDKSIKTKFRIDSGEISEYLTEGKTYIRNY